MSPDLWATKWRSEQVLLFLCHLLGTLALEKLFLGRSNVLFAHFSGVWVARLLSLNLVVLGFPRGHHFTVGKLVPANRVMDGQPSSHSFSGQSKPHLLILAERWPRLALGPFVRIVR